MGFMNTDIVNGRRNERKRCNEAAMRTKRPLRVGYINAIRYWGAPVPKTDLASNRVHVSVPRAQDRNHIAGVTFHVFSGKEEYCKYEYERFWMASPAMAWAQMATYCDTEALATIASAFASREERRKKARKDDFAAYLDASPRFAGKRKCEEALPYVFCQVVIGQCGVSFPSEKAVGFSPVRNWPVIARVLLFHCIRA